MKTTVRKPRTMKNHQASSQKFRQLILKYYLAFRILNGKDIINQLACEGYQLRSFKFNNITIVCFSRTSYTPLSLFTYLCICKSIILNEALPVIIIFILVFLSHNHHHHHVTPPAWISLILSRHPSLSFIASSRSSRLHPESAQSCCM